MRHGKQLLRCLPLVGMLFATSSVNAADSQGGVKFNKDVRYSQWAINSRLYDFRGNQKAYGFASWDATNGKGNYANKSNMKIDYVAGLVGKATLEASDYYSSFDWAKPWFKSAEAYATDYKYSAQDQAKMTLDNMNAAKMALHIVNNKWASDNAKTTASAAITAIINDLKYYNENYVIGGTKSDVKEATANDVQKKMLGGWFHKYNYVDQVWCDGMYMGPALLAQLINYKDASSKVSNDDWSLLTKQFTITWEQLRDAKTGLMYHGMTATPTTTDWSKATDATSYHSGAFWGRANAWYMLALVDVLEVMPSNNANYSMLKGYLENLAASIASYQNEDGTWYQVLDQKDNALNGNYEESSCSALFTAAYLKAIRLNLLDSNKYETMAKKAYVALVDKFMSYDKNDNSKIQILSSCCSAGLGTNNNSLRDGSRSYYITGKDSKAVTGENTEFYYTEGKVLGGFIMAATEYERAYQNQDSKQILFAKDLAPKYDFSTTGGSLDATAYGEGTPSYQWYKDGAKIADATFATFSPKESGEYYCTATVGNNTIQTSATTVTANTATEGGDNNSGETTTGTVLFSYTMPTSGSGIDNDNATGGEITYGSNYKPSTDGYKLDRDFGKTKYVKVSLSGNTLNEGDIIKITANSSTAGKGGLVAYTGTTNGSTSVSLGNMTQKNEIITYIVTASDCLKGLNTFYIYRKAGESTYVKAITITRTVTKLTATFAPNSVTATVGDASVTVPPLTVKAGEATLALSTDYTVSYSSDKVDVVKVENGTLKPVAKGDAFITATITPVDKTKYNETTATFTVNVEEKAVTDPTTTTVYDFKNGVGSAKSSNAAIEVNTDNIVFGTHYKPLEGKYITITPANGGFKAGDVITIKGTSTKGNALMTLNSTLDSETSEQYQFNALGTTETTYQYILQADCPVLYLGRAFGSTATITGLTVTRAAAAENKTRLVATFPSNSITVVNKTPTVKLPELTVKAGNTELTNEQYTVVKKSDNPAVATISGDEITIKGIGTATIFATITPEDQTNYEGCIATYQVTVKEPTPLSVSTMDVTINTVDAEVKQPVIKVYGDNDKLLTLGKDYTLTYSVKGENVTVDEAGMFKVAGEPYKWTEGSSTVTVKATPTTTLGNTYKEGTLTFEYNVIKGKITPVFHESFNGATIRVKTDTKKDKTFSVPLIYDGEDVSEYFDYTYTINGRTPVEINTNNKVSGDTLTFRPAANGTYIIKVTAKPNTGKVNDDADDYSQVYNEPVLISFTVNVGNFTRPTVTVDPSTMTMYTGTFESAADVTVMNGKDIIPDNKYKLAWRSFTPGIVKVDADGNIEAVSEGNGDIRVSVYGENLETMTAFLKVYVDDPALYRAKTKDNDGKEVKYGNQRVMWNQDKTMSVSLGGWMFPNDVTVTNETTTEALSSKNKWEDAASLAKWKLTGFDHVVLSDASQNARQENGSNAMPESTDLYNAKFVNKGTVVDKMFNVPCTGSYLAFNPAINGLVRVHIFQSGAFDSANGKYQYRPQRRVFVMDEAGNFVKSSAEIENANGKPKGGVQALSKYKWDLKSENAPTPEEVRKHFPKLPTSFAMTDAGFQNNVMESGLDNVPNNVPTNHKDEPGANGWCVLADSPVTYSFRVKAGKTYYLYNFGSKIGFYGYSFEEDATKPKVDEVNYDEAATNTVTATENGHVAKVTINRSFEAGKWTTCVLPFSLNKHQVDAIFGTTYGITKNDDGSTTENTDGTQILYFDHVAGNKAYFVRHAYNTIVAGKPFLIKPAKKVTSINTAEVTDYPYVTIENEKPAEWRAGNDYAWVSSYSNDMTVKEGDCFISNKDGHFKNFVGDPGTLKGFRGYLKAKLANGAKPQTLSVGMDSNVNEEGTSAIIGLTIDADGNIVTGVADGKVYNVNGQVVSEDSRNFGALPSGVYVINGKKYVK